MTRSNTPVKLIEIDLGECNSNGRFSSENILSRIGKLDFINAFIIR
jgi:hypothetical protein